jgi:hypothetical protein
MAPNFTMPTRISQRDEILDALGWNVFRLEGHECKRTYDPPWLEEDDFHMHKWFESTSAGFLYSLKQTYFTKHRDRYAIEHSSLVDDALNMHRKTIPENLPARTAA